MIKGSVLLGPDWEIVYQGGHHNVYCNSSVHFSGQGGVCHKDVDLSKPVIIKSLTLCDCDKWLDK